LRFSSKNSQKSKSSWNIKKWQFYLILKKLFDVGFSGNSSIFYLSFLFLFNFLECFFYNFFHPLQRMD
jgi:hypothetical protein